jgi:hypothetical protein
MDMQEIQVNINKDGKVSVSLQGVKGKACLDITKELETLLGNEIMDRKFKHEYYDPPNPQTASLSSNSKK